MCWGAGFKYQFHLCAFDQLGERLVVLIKSVIFGAQDFVKFPLQIKSLAMQEAQHCLHVSNIFSAEYSLYGDPFPDHRIGDIKMA